MVDGSARNGLVEVMPLTETVDVARTIARPHAPSVLVDHEIEVLVREREGLSAQGCWYGPRVRSGPFT